MEISREIINSNYYKDVILKVKNKTRLRILADYNDAAAKRDSQKLIAANISFDEVIKILQNDFDKFFQFILLKMKKYEKIKIEEDFPKGEEIEDEFDNEKVLGYSQGFILIYLIEYYLLKNNPNELENYLKLIRIPQAKKYSKELNDLFKKI